MPQKTENRCGFVDAIAVRKKFLRLVILRGHTRADVFVVNNGDKKV